MWVRVECPAKLDLSGGFTDIPPICYEHGSAVCNVAVTVNGKRPNGVRMRKISEPIIKLIDLNTRPEDEADDCLLVGKHEDFTLEIKSIDDLRDFNKPSAPGRSYQTKIGILYFNKIKIYYKYSYLQERY